MNEKIRIGVALSGGGARGAAHIGVLKALNELGIFPHHLSGSSSGALIAALYGAGYSPKEIQEMSIKHSFLKIFKIGFTSKGLTDPRFLSSFLNDHLKGKTFNDLKTTVSIGVTNINKGEFKVLEQGDVSMAVRASCAIPMLFKPLEIDGELYVDGGLMNNLPVEPLKKSCTHIIGVGVCPHSYESPVTGITDVAVRSFQLALWNTMSSRMKRCDVAIDVKQAHPFGLFDFKSAQKLFDVGYEAVMQQMKEIQALTDH